MSADLGVQIDNLCLDMNGIFHTAAQKVYGYGNYDRPAPKLHPVSESTLKRRLFGEIGNIISNLVFKTRPTKRILVMVDGVAGVAKQSQQLQRRYRSILDVGKKFDTNSISPGTELMDHLSKYLDYFFREKCTTSPMWRHLEIIFSNDKVPSEGEHKIICFIRIISGLIFIRKILTIYIFMGCRVIWRINRFYVCWNYLSFTT
jgi:5'-3' exoribonuclease 2